MICTSIFEELEQKDFKLIPVEFCGKLGMLIHPKSIGSIWDETNLNFRSLICDTKGKVLSSGWPKFFNYGEKPHLYPDIAKFNDLNILEKKDGTLVICDFVEGVFSMRTRGTISYKSQENWRDFEKLLLKHPKVIDVLMENSNVLLDLSLLFELCTPNNVIVIKPDDIEFTFLGAVNKHNLTCVNYEQYKALADAMEVPIPKSYSYSSLLDLINDVKNFNDSEGVVVSYNNNQNRIKIKSDWYNNLHHILNGVNTLNSLIDIWKSTNYLNRSLFEQYIEKVYSWEALNIIKELIDELFLKQEKVLSKIESLRDFLTCDEVKSLTRKEQAAMILGNYPQWASAAFNILDNNPNFKYEKYFDLV